MNVINKKTNNKPKLRFSGFDDSWEIKKLSEVASVQRGRFTPRPRNDPRFYGGHMPFVQTGDIVNSGGYVKKYSQTLNEEGVKVSKVFPKGSILMTIAASIGYTGILSEDMACPDSLVGIIPFNDTDNRFLNYYLSTKRKHMDRVAAQAAQKNINIGFLNPYPVAWTKFEEQKKIANFLESVDAWLDNLHQQKTALETYKRGMVQKLFTQQVHFKNDNGEEFPKWKQCQLQDVIQKSSTGLNPRDNFILGEGDFFYVTIKNISKGKLDLSSAEKINKHAFDLINKRSDLKKHDIIISSIGNIGEAYLLQEDPVNWNINESVFTIRPDVVKISPSFLYHVIASDSTKKHFINNVTGSSFKSIKHRELKLTPVLLPTLEEQQKIADFLTSIDQVITVKSEEITKVERWKAGLIQKMFI